MATVSSILNDSSTSSSTINTHTTKSSQHLSRSLERALDEAAYTCELVLNGRKLREFPNYTYKTTKCDLSDTITADLSRNRFTEFPRVLCSFFSLEYLNLYDNIIKSIPEQIIQIRLLKVLDLSRNQLAYIPPTLCKLSNLEVLIINNNKLVSLPEEIGQLEKLIELDVSSNDLTQLPYQIGTLIFLRTLQIRRNMIIELPTELCNLKLIHFDCSFNRITRLPLNLREMVSLIELNVENNPLESPPASVCTLGLLHVMRFLLVEAMKEEKRRGLLTEHEINSKYRNSFSYQGSRHLQCGTQMKKTVVPSDSGYLTTESSEKTIGDDDSVLSMPNDNSLRSEPTLMLTLADEFSKELARQKADYDKKKCQAYQLKLHLLQQLGETETQRAKTREVARRTHDEKLAKMEKQREDARRKMENSRNIQLFNFSSKQRSWPSSTLNRQLSNVESSISGTIINDNSENYKSYQRSLSVDDSTVDDLLLRKNRAVSVEPTLNRVNNDIKIKNGHNHHYLHHQRSSPNGSIRSNDNTVKVNRQFTSSDTIDESITISQSIVMNQMPNNDRKDDIPYNHFEESRLAKLRYFDNGETDSNRTILSFNSQSKGSSFKNGQNVQSSLDDPAFTMRHHLLHPNEDHLQIEQLKKTIEERLKVTLPDDIGYALNDGVVLCHFINQIRARSVQSIHVPSQAVPKLSSAKCRRNVENFIDASRRIGVPEVDLCTAEDIIEEKHTTIMSFTQELKLPTYEELECPVINVSSPALRAGSFHLAKYCDLQFKEFMLCRQEEQDPRKCIKEGKEVSLCSIDFFRKVRDTCNDTFTTFWTCLDNGPDGEMSFNSCKQEQRAFAQCAKDKMNVERPEPGYFSMVRMHDSKRPIPSDPFRIGSLERHPPKLEVPDPPTIAQADEYPEARIGMKFGHRKPWMFEAKLWD
ncbi:unnamed protein product [Rotaria magnacalcarata]|uniref:Calponin-homology (CH) domain-containing protein n=1 Tax=Rotaria magnacalcarata TaxID=392030 RepID=A0A815A8A9_9BILA|nr:unnamed protein product [Rotaria magnacalcarata]CAF1662421.1 unnamed protein product [Rotaria magnacalcarata]CAF1989827.1 unnamed protein product [Rotaria magnacalcarata]CAF2029262.1 unnamed protein product [Rotaria magnacalcarata]CAF2074105.1 unnamed protein product [Rotaria magnacalcarata]